MNVTFEGNSSTGKNEWLTPPQILIKLGHFDLDPCSPINRPWNTASHHFTIEDDGLKQQWFGRVFCNPPYDTELITQFIHKCAEHKNALALTFARTDTKLFHNEIFKKADSILFIKGRLKFFHVTGKEGGTAGAPSCLISFNEENSKVLMNCGIEGKFVRISRNASLASKAEHGLDFKLRPDVSPILEKDLVQYGRQNTNTGTGNRNLRKSTKA